MLRIAVIGTAGRGEDGQRLLPSDFNRMLNTVEEIIFSITKDPYLVSGGAAWADHTAVAFTHKHARYTHLQLHLPAQFDFEKKCYVENGRQSPGSISNYYHHLCSNKIQRNTLQELNDVLIQSQHTVNDGFFKRNNLVANVDVVIALTFGEKAKLKDGGTYNTFKQFLKNHKNISFHVDLNTWSIYNNAQL